MKKNKLYTAVILSVLLFTNNACTEVTDYDDGRISYEEIFQNDQKTAAYLNLCYSAVDFYGMQYGNNTLLAGFTDEAHDANDAVNGSAYTWYKGRVTAYSNPINNDWWEQYWAGIRYCNIFLSNIDNATLSLERNRAGWRAQAHILRAYYYLQLIKRYGGVPVITEPSPIHFDYSKIKKTTFTTTARQILADCDEALQVSDSDLGWRSGNAESDRGKVTKAMAYAIKSETALYAASPLWNDGSFTWSEAAQITQEALNACLNHGYELYSQAPAGNVGYLPYDVYFYSRSDVNGATDKETIFESKSQMPVFMYNGLPIVNGMIKCGDCPSQELVDAYETTDGVAPILGYSDDEHLHPIINPEATLYNEADPYANRDPRLKASIYYNGALFNLGDGNSRVWTYEGGNCERSTTSMMHTRTGYYLRKYSNFNSDKNSNKDGYFKMFRLAELYLNAAEALNEASNGTAPQEAINAINAIRSRVGMPGVPQNMSQADFRKKVRNERRVELAFEEHRFYDVRRWKILSETDKVITGMSCQNNNGSFTYQRFVVDKDRKAYTDKYLIMPIPGDEAIRLKENTGVNYQNPGWE